MLFFEKGIIVGILEEVFPDRRVLIEDDGKRIKVEVLDYD